MWETGWKLSTTKQQERASKEVDKKIRQPCIKYGEQLVRCAPSVRPSIPPLDSHLEVLYLFDNANFCEYTYVGKIISTYLGT